MAIKRLLLRYPALLVRYIIQLSMVALLFVVTKLLMRLQRKHSAEYKHIIWVERRAKRIGPPLENSLKAERIQILVEQLGWDLSNVIHVEVEDYPDVGTMSAGDVTMRGFLAFPDNASLILWKLAHQYKD